MIKKFLMMVVMFCVGFFTMYLTGVFVAAEFNIKEWSSGLREVIGLAGFVFGVICTTANNLSSTSNHYDHYDYCDYY